MTLPNQNNGNKNVIDPRNEYEKLFGTASYTTGIGEIRNPEEVHKILLAANRRRKKLGQLPKALR